MKDAAKTSTLKTIMLIANSMFVSLFLIGGAYFTFRYFTRADTNCMTREQVSSDSRCLYIYSGKIYNKGTKDAPHQGNPCGSDVTAILPQNHITEKTSRLDPNYIGDVCVASSIPSATPTTAALPTSTTAPAPTVAQPTSTSAPSNNQTTVTNTPVPTSATSATFTPTRTPTQTSSNQNSQNSTTVTPRPTALPVAGNEIWLAPAISSGLIFLGVLGVLL